MVSLVSLDKGKNILFTIPNKIFIFLFQIKYYLRVMEAKKQLKQRHKEAVVELKKAAAPYIDKGLNDAAKKIGKNVGVSFQTVVNYVYGKTKDGYLTEAITKEFLSL